MNWPLSFRFAARELRSGVAGFRIFLACLAVGVAAIAAAGSTGEAFRQGLASQARDILGGDLAVSADRAFDPAERQALAPLGRVSYAAGVNVMAQAPSGLRRLADLRGVDELYPLAGTVDLTGPDGRPMSLAQALAPVEGLPGAAVEQAMLDKLDLKLGDRFLAGNQQLAATAVLGAERQRLVDLRKVNDHVRPEEVELAQEQLRRTREAIGQARLRLDSLRVVVEDISDS